MTDSPSIRVRRTRLKRDVALEILRETPEQSAEFHRLHEQGSLAWGQRWLKVNEWVVIGSQIGARGVGGTEAIRLMLTHIAYRLCVQLYGAPDVKPAAPEGE
jgi:hypothetical protein